MTPPIAIGGRAVNPAIAELAETPAWVCWRTVQRGGKPTKPPFTPAGIARLQHRPGTWSTFDECFVAAFVDGRHDGIGRVLPATTGSSASISMMPAPQTARSRRGRTRSFRASRPTGSARLQAPVCTLGARPLADRRQQPRQYRGLRQRTYSDRHRRPPRRHAR